MMNSSMWGFDLVWDLCIEDGGIKVSHIPSQTAIPLPLKLSWFVCPNEEKGREENL